MTVNYSNLLHNKSRGLALGDNTILHQYRGHAMAYSMALYSSSMAMRWACCQQPWGSRPRASLFAKGVPIL